VIYAYGICEPAIAMSPWRRRGLGDATLRSLRSGPIAAIYSRHRSLRVRPEPAQVLRHEHVVEAMMARGPVLPLRFGTELQSEEQLAAAIAGRADELSRALERVRGRVELALRVIPERIEKTNSRTAPVSGREMLLGRVREHQRTIRVAQQLHAPLARAAADSTMHNHPRPPAILTASYLVDEDRIAAFRRQADQLAARQDGLRVLVTGPWPPYSFATVNEP
jgi:hypothetical protein